MEIGPYGEAEAGAQLGLEGSRKVGVGVEVRTINKLILKRDRDS